MSIRPPTPPIVFMTKRPSVTPASFGSSRSVWLRHEIGSPRFRNARRTASSAGSGITAE